MFILFIIYFICVFFIWWSYSGYLFYLSLYFLLRRGQQEKEIFIKKYPGISVIIPVFEEEKIISVKIKNLLQLKYPGKKEFIFCDGGSGDKTAEIIQKAVQKNKKIKLIFAKNGKVNQLNKALEKAQGKMIVVTDADALLPQNGLIILANSLYRNSLTGLVGAYVIPKGFSLEKAYWQEQNQLRVVESMIYSSSIIVAPCYAFRKSLLDKFPDDCVADDVFISFYTQSKNLLVKYESKVVVYETRSPKNLLEFFTHKFRKANAYISEILRFVYAVNKFNSRSKIIYLSRFIQIILLPWILILFLAISVNLFIINYSYREAVGAVFLFLLINLFLAGGVFDQRIFNLKLPGGKIKVLNLKVFIYSSLVLFFAIFTYLFFNQNSNYEKINQ